MLFIKFIVYYLYYIVYPWKRYDWKLKIKLLFIFSNVG